MILTNRGGRFVRGASAPRTPVPVLGPEIIVNRTFDDASWWLVESDWTVAAGVATHTTPAATGSVYRNSILTTGVWYQSQFEVIGATAGRIRHDPFPVSTSYPLASINGTQLVTDRAGGPYMPYRAYLNFDGALDNPSLKALTLSSIISTKRYSSANCDLSAGVTRTAGTQAGFAMRVDNPANPANFIIAYETGAGRIKVEKCLSGAYTTIIDAAITYGDGVGLRGVCNGTTVTVYYNGVLVGTAQVTDAAIVGNQNHGLFSTYASNTFTNYRNRVGEWVLYQDAPVPVAGAEEIVNGTMEADANWTSDNSPTTNERSSTQAYSGTYSRRVVAAGSYSGIRQSRNWTSGWLKFQYQFYPVAPSTAFWFDWRDKFGTANEQAITGLTSDAWNLRMFTARDTTTLVSGGLIRFRSYPGAAEFFVDDVSVVPLISSSLISTLPYASADIDLYAGVGRLDGTQVGFALRVDDPDNPQNFILVYETGAGRVKADKVVSGIYTNVLDAAITYGAGVGLRAVVNGTGVSVWYNGVQVGSTVTVADASIRYNTNHGLFSTHSSNTFADYVAIAMMAL